MQEFDLDGALTRRPSLLLVDEYAHTNVPGSRHPKRWQDVDELLAAGIDVWTTLNIQHLESLNDVVQKISKIRVRETVPDTVFDRADEIVLVDFPPDELLKRLAEGKVYVQDTAARAVEHFFKPQNLTALRELALRRAAERIDADLVERMQAQAIEGPWAAGERILACIGADPVSPTVVRAAKRLADLMDAPWIAVTVERPGTTLDDGGRQRLDEAMKLAQSLGAETQTLTGTDLPAELLRFAKFENVTQIVVGRSRGSFFSELLGRSLPHELVRRTQDIAIHLVTKESEAPAKRSFFRLAQHIAGQSMAFSVRGRRRGRGIGDRQGADNAYADSQSVDGLSSRCACDGDERRHVAGDFRVDPVFSRLQFLFHPADLHIHHCRALRAAGTGDFPGCRGHQLGNGRTRARAGADCGRAHARHAQAL